MNLEFCKFLITTNRDLITRTAIKDCHVKGLHSFIINESPRIRLFIADQTCPLFKPFDPLNPIIPIHPHKYDDIFIPIEGTLRHHIYITIKKGGIVFNKYIYPRIGDMHRLTNVRKQSLWYTKKTPGRGLLKANRLHTVSLAGQRCSWLVIETFQDQDFDQYCYHKDLKEDPALYKEFNKAVEYLYAYFNI